MRLHRLEISHCSSSVLIRQCERDEVLICWCECRVAGNRTIEIGARLMRFRSENSAVVDTNLAELIKDLGIGWIILRRLTSDGEHTLGIPDGHLRRAVEWVRLTDHTQGIEQDQEAIAPRQSMVESLGAYCMLPIERVDGRGYAGPAGRAQLMHGKREIRVELHRPRVQHVCGAPIAAA